MDVKPLSDIASKYATETPKRSRQYAEGVAKTPKDWAQCTLAAENNFEDGINRALANKSFGKGVQEAGTAKYKKGVAVKGESHFKAGVAIAGPDFQKGFAPYHEELQRTTLPQKYARRDPRNLERVEAVCTALGNRKEAML